MNYTGFYTKHQPNYNYVQKEDPSVINDYIKSKYQHIVDYLYLDENPTIDEFEQKRQQAINNIKKTKKDDFNKNIKLAIEYEKIYKTSLSKGLLFSFKIMKKNYIKLLKRSIYFIKEGTRNALYLNTVLNFEYKKSATTTNIYVYANKELIGCFAYL